MDALSRRIKELRLAKGWTMMKLAKEAWVSDTVVCHVENGVDIRPHSLYSIAKALGVEPIELAKLMVERLDGHDKAKSRTGKTQTSEGQAHGDGASR